MRAFNFVALVGGAALLVAAAPMEARQDGTASSKPGSSTTTPITITPALFAGNWVYNADQSVDAASGRPERGRRRTGASARPPTPGSGATGGSGGGTGGGYTGSTGYGGTSGGYSGGPPTGFGMVFVDELHELRRDLLEVPERLAIKIESEAVTFTDDLNRTRTYPTTNKKQKYQLGAAVFQARARWDGVQFEKNIEANEGFKLRETYFLSEDGQRLFIVIRVGDPASQIKNAPIVGANRVYDRVRAQ